MSLDIYVELNDIINYVFINIPNILNTEDIPDDIILTKGYVMWINSKYYSDILFFITSDSKIKTNEYVLVLKGLFKTLKRLGYKTY